MKPARTSIRFLPILLTGLLLATSAAPLCAQTLPASAGTEFYVGMPFFGLAENASLRLSVTAVASTTVRLEFLETGNVQSQFVEPGTPWEFTIARSIIVFEGQSEGRTNRVIRITSDRPVVVHASQDASWFTDMWVVPPVSQAGRDFRLMSVWSTTSYGAVAMAVATEDDTRLRITPTVPTSGGHPAGFSYGITLQKGEAWQVVPLQPEFTDMSGTRFESDKPIMLIGGHAGTMIEDDGAANPLAESFTPTPHWGTEFHSVATPNREIGYYKILAHKNSTQVKVNGVEIALLNAGESLVHKNPNPVDITTNEPVSVAQFTFRKRDSVHGRPTGDPSMTLLQPYGAWATEYRWVTQNLPPRIDGANPTIRVPFAGYMMLTAPADFTDSIYFDNVDISGFFDILHTDPEWKTAVLPVYPGEHHLVSSVPVAAQLLGYSDFDAYFTPAGYRIPKPLRLKPISARTCAPFLDTILALRNFADSAVRLDSVRFSGIEGTVLFPQFPATINRLGMGGLRLRIAAPTSGELRGSIYLYTSSDPIPYRIPILVRHETVAGSFSVANIDFTNATDERPVIDTIVRYRNDGEVPLTIRSRDITPPFSLLSPSLPHTLQPGEETELHLRFAPDTIGTYTGALLLETAPCDLASTLGLIGRRTDKPEIAVEVGVMPQLLCPDEEPGILRIVVYSRGGAPVVIDSARIGGEAGGDYAPENDPAGAVILPGDSLVLELRFNPGDTGVRRGILRLFHNAEPDVSEVELSGRKDSVLLETSLPEVDFGTILLCDGTDRREITLYNRGTVRLALDESTLQNGNFDLEGAVDTIPPNDSLRLTLVYTPGAAGELRDTLLIDASPCSIEKRIPVHAIIVGPSLAVDETAINFGLLSTCDAPRTLTLRLTNDGDIPDTITTLLSDGTEFTLAPLADSTLAPGASIEIAVTFSPDETGTFERELTIRAEPCGIERKVLLRGEHRRVEVDPVVEDIALGTFLPGESDQGATVLRNTGELPVTIEEIAFDDRGGRLQRISPPSGTVIPPGDSVRIVFAYTSENAEGIDAEITVTFREGCPEPIGFAVGGEPGTIPLHLVVPPASGLVDQTVPVPLYLENPTGFRGSIRLRGELRWEYRNLYMKGMNPVPSGGNIAIGSDTIAGSDRIIRFLYEGELPRNAPDLLAEIRLLVLLGTDDSTLIDVEVFEIVPLSPENTLQLTTDGGIFTTLGICPVDGERFVRIDEPIRAARAVPNPVDDYLEIELVSNAETEGELALYDNGGRKVRERAFRMEQGNRTLGLSVDDLPPGLYHYVIAVGTDRITGEILIRR